MTAGTDAIEPRLRLGVVGCGRVFERFHLPALRLSRHWQLVGACEIHPERRRWLEKEVAMPVVDSPRELLRSTTPDALLIATPPQHHLAPALEALRSGVHVLVEKPMAMSSTEAAEMVAAARSSGCHLRVGFHRRFRSNYVGVGAWLKDRAAAPITALRHVLMVDLNWNRVDDWAAEQPARRAMLDDVASHQLDLVPFLLSRPIHRIRATAATPDHLVRRHVEYTLDLGEELFAFCVAGYDTRYRERLTIESPSRTLVCQPGGLFETRTGRESVRELRGRVMDTLELLRARLTARPSQSVLGFAAQLDAFSSVLVRGHSEPAGASGAAGLQAVLAIEALESSLDRGGEWIRLE